MDRKRQSLEVHISNVKLGAITAAERADVVHGGELVGGESVGGELVGGELVGSERLRRVYMVWIETTWRRFPQPGGRRGC